LTQVLLSLNHHIEDLKKAFSLPHASNFSFYSFFVLLCAKRTGLGILGAQAHQPISCFLFTPSHVYFL
ncbi:MAG: hypothetical protein ACJAVH_000648, partial [Bacteroidia bacterium]